MPYWTQVDFARSDHTKVQSDPAKYKRAEYKIPDLATVIITLLLYTAPFCLLFCYPTKSSMFVDV